MMKQAVFKDQQLLDDVHWAKSARPDDLNVWWLGQSGFLCHAGGRSVLFDPYLSDSLSEKYADTEKPHERMTERVIAPEALSDIDVVTSTHNHTDHLDRETILPLREANPEMALIIPEANRDFVSERLGTSHGWPVGLEDGKARMVEDIRFVGIPAAHNTVERDEEGRCRFLGYVVQWAGWTVYHSGDTLPIEGLADLLRGYPIDLAFLPINGRLEERRVAGNLWGQEAAALADGAEIDHVVPCHYDMFTFNTETPVAFEEACRKRDLNYTVLGNGERLSIRRKPG